MPAMKKQLAIELLGGTVSAAAKTLGVSYAAVHKWPDELPRRISDRVEGAYARRKRQIAAQVAAAEAARRDPNPQRSGAAERYRVVIARGRKYPGGRVNKKGGKPLTAVMTGRYLECGTEDQPAEPWMTPAYMNKREAALTTVVDEMGKGVQKAIRKAQQGAKK